MLEYNSAGSFDLVNLFIVQQEYEMQRKNFVYVLTVYLSHRLLII